MSNTSGFEVSRRGVLVTGVAAGAMASVPGVAAATPPAAGASPPTMAVTLKVNGKAGTLDLDTRTTL
ncbi:MAG TPA: aldehyde dehydrogenase iron-sulfur subunit, partial [Sphingomonas sp.]|nr:aldehyde dehydrogenase iron-sulfur subunit [Sphingomonas sp.]